MPAISSSSPCTAFSRSPASAYSSEVSAPLGCSILDRKEFFEGFLLTPKSVVGSDFGISSLGANALGESLRFSLLVMSESGAPIYPSKSKSVMRYHQRSKAKTAQMDTSLIDEAVLALCAPVTQFLGASSQALGGTVVQSSPKPGGGVGKSPSPSFLRRGFILPSVPSPLSGCASPIAENEVNFRTDGLIQSQKWPVSFGLSGKLLCGIEVWVEEEEDSPYPLGVCPPDMPLDWASDGVEDKDLSFTIMDAIEEDFHRVKKGTRLKTKEKRVVES
jgi:hypothetical protein